MSREEIPVRSISEAYVKLLALATVERAKVGSIANMATRLGISSEKLKNLESLKIVDPRVLDAYIRELDITFTGKIKL